MPETVVVPREQIETFRLDEQTKAAIGVPYVVKPAWGDYGVGVVVDADSEEALLWSAEQAPNADAFLIQRRLVPRNLAHMSAGSVCFTSAGRSYPAGGTQ